MPGDDNKNKTRQIMGGSLASPFRNEPFDAVHKYWRSIKIDPEDFADIRVEGPAAESEDHPRHYWFRMQWGYAASRGVGLTELDEAAQELAPQMFAKARKMFQQIIAEEQQGSLADVITA